jgi:DNA-binding CsgD family transcriptional regulator
MPIDLNGLANRLALLRQESLRVRSHANPHAKILRNLIMVQMAADGMSLREIAAIYGITRNRVGIIVRRHRT